MAKKKTEAGNDLLAALAHPLRRQVMRRMRDEPEGLSPLELSDEFEMPVSNMAYHVRVLASCGALRLVKVKPVRGAIKHFYRSSLSEPWAQQIIDLEPWDPKRNRPVKRPKSRAK